MRTQLGGPGVFLPPSFLYRIHHSQKRVARTMNEKSLRVCLLTYRGNPRSGGQGIYTRLLSKELADLGHRVDVLSGQPYPELFDHPNIRLIKVPSLDLWNEEKPFRMPNLAELRDPINRSEWVRTMVGGFPEPRTFTERVARMFEEQGLADQYDIVHDNQCLGIGLLEVRKHVPVVATIHHPITMDFKVALKSTRNPYRRFGMKRWYNSFLPMQINVARHVDRLLTISEASADDISADFGIERTRLRMVGNGINTEVFKPDPSIEREDELLLSTLSADVPLKGMPFLLEALDMLRRERPKLRLVVIGSMKEDSATRQTLNRLNLQDHVEFTGRVTAEEIARRYAMSTCAVVPSVYEGFGFPAGEAMCCEVPLVSTTGGALPEVVGEHGKTGILVEPSSAEALAAGIREVLEMSDERRREMGAAARKRVLENFTWRKTTERTVENYREVIEERRRQIENGEWTRKTGTATGSTADLRRHPVAASDDVDVAARVGIDGASRGSMVAGSTGDAG